MTSRLHSGPTCAPFWLVNFASQRGQPLKIRRAIEVGHVFKLGTKYSIALNALFLDESGKQQPCIMGCYGIGVTRTLQAIIEQCNDKDGIIWPISVAPYPFALRRWHVNLGARL